MSTVRSCWECVTCGNLDIICFFSFLFSLYLLYLFFSCLLPISLVDKVDYNVALALERRRRLNGEPSTRRDITARGDSLFNSVVGQTRVEVTDQRPGWQRIIFILDVITVTVRSEMHRVTRQGDLAYRQRARLRTSVECIYSATLQLTSAFLSPSLDTWSDLLTTPRIMRSRHQGAAHGDRAPAKLVRAPAKITGLIMFHLGCQIKIVVFWGMF